MSSATVHTCKQVVTSLLTRCVHTACSKLLEKVRNKLLTTGNKLDGTIRLVTWLFQQDCMIQSWYSNFVTVLCFQLCDNLVTTGLFH